MKGKLALFLSLLMLVAALLPIQTFAAGDKGLEEAIKIAKFLFGISEYYSDFDYSSSTYNGRTVWYLHWSHEDEGGVSVQVDDRGTVISYDSYKYYDHNQRKLPRVSKDKAIKIAKEFINKVNPDALKQIELDDRGINYLNDPFYYFYFYRVHNGIPFPDNRVTVSVNKQTGEVQSYNYNWTDNLNFPDAQKKISLAEAQKAYQDKLGLKLVYKSNHDGKNMKVYLAYVPACNSNVCIDALTGEKLELYPDYYGVGGMGGMAEEEAIRAKSKAIMEAGEIPVSLSPEEIKAIQEVTKLLSRDEAEARAREIEQLELTDEYKVVRAGISRDWIYQNEFTWYLYFEKPAAEGKNERCYVNVTLDGVTGELESFYRNCESPGESGEAKYDKAGARKAVEEFLKTLIPDKFKNLQYEDSSLYEIYPAQEAPRHYDFRYTRLVDGVPYVNNTVTVSFDAVSGKVEGYSITWIDMEFPDKDKVISIDKAYESLFGKIGLELQYKLKYTDALYRKYGFEETTTPEVVLVYMLDQGKPGQLDAVTGEILNQDGSVYEEQKPVAYTDIAGHFAEKEIKALAEFGITLPGTEFKPNDGIIQKDFLSLLSKIENWPPLSGEGTEEEIEKMYTYLIRNGIVKEAEKNPTAPVTREESIKFIIRALKYDKVAELPGIFVCKFADAAEINPALYGYVTIAHALNLVNGDNHNRFNPAKQLTRGEAALIIYRMLELD